MRKIQFPLLQGNTNCLSPIQGKAPCAAKCCDLLTEDQALLLPIYLLDLSNFYYQDHI